MQREQHAVSIIIPTLNEEGVVGNLLADLVAQTYQDFEVIVVDGSSEDGTRAEIANFTSELPHLSVLRTKKRNVSHQRNTGAQHATGDWLIFMDADNRIESHFLQGIAYFIDKHNPDIAAPFFDTRVGNPKDRAIARVANLFVLIQKSTSNPYVSEACMVVRKEVFDAIGGFDKEIPFAEGSEMLRNARRLGYTFAVIKDPTFHYSLRRLKKQGTLHSVRAFTEIEVTRLLTGKAPSQKASSLYPMKGGSFYAEKSHTYLESVLVHLSKLKSLPEQLKNMLLEDVL